MSSKQSLLSFFQKAWGTNEVGIRPLAFGIILTIILLIIPTGFEGKAKYKHAEKSKATVISIDDSAIVSAGLIRTGEQVCTVRIEDGLFEGKTVRATNLLSGSLSQDKEFKVGDVAFVSISHSGDKITSTTMIDHYRIRLELILALLFCVFMLLFAGPAGIKSILSFIITVLCIWKIMIPYSLRGGNPIFCGLFLTTFLTIIIIAFVYGLDRRSFVSISGSMLGVITACVLGMIFTKALNIHGAIMVDSESLIYSGYQHLNLTKIFMATIFVAASGAMMDLAVDITSGMCEVLMKKPDISRVELMGSGIRIGQAAMGTMSTTLLLAYAGGCLTQLMVFMAQGTPIQYILNYKYVAAEILQTIAGSFALVTVAPFTAIVGGIILTRAKHNN